MTKGCPDEIYIYKTTKECLAPQSEDPTLLLTPLSTHLRFRCTEKSNLEKMLSPKILSPQKNFF